MTTVSTRIEFRQNNGESRSNEFSVNVPEDVDEGREVRVARTIFAEVGVVFSPKSLPIHNATALAWLNFPNVPADFSELHDIQNSQGLWQELTNLVLSTEHDLIDAFAFKSLEPVEEPAFENDPEIEQLHYLHNRKMELLDQSVYKLIKVQDLVNRLLHESLGGDLVDTTLPDWEETRLKRRYVQLGLERKRTNGELTQVDFDQISSALSRASSFSQLDLAIKYRNRMTHHIHPSVDYPMFYASILPRIGQPILNSFGEVVGSHQIIYARTLVEYRFLDLSDAYRAYLGAVVIMLDELSRVAMLRR